MLVSPDVNLVARMLIDQHGSDCRGLAAQKAHELCEEGNFRGLEFWNRVIRAIDEALKPIGSASAVH